MDLLECEVCDQRYLVSHAGDGMSWTCPADSQELRLVALGLPGTPAQIEAALNARALGGADAPSAGAGQSA